jgi:hypothetical protein
MLSFCMRNNSVDRLMPSRAAAPLGPPTFPIVFSSAVTISLRSGLPGSSANYDFHLYSEAAYPYEGAVLPLTA